VGVGLISTIRLIDFRDPSTVYFERGLVEYNTGNNPRAIDNYNEAIRLKPNYPNAYIYRAMAKSALGDTKGAEADFDKGRQLQ
jgi:tetratricopeptide (TPR) repeat protein